MNKHTAQLPDGNVATRNSKTRVYTHAVALGPAKASKLIERNEAFRNQKSGEAARYAKTVESLHTATITNDGNGYWRAAGVDYPVFPSAGVTTEDEAREHLLSQYREFAAEAFESVSRTNDRIAELALGPELVGSWEAVTWCGRADLAAKQAASYAGNSRGSVVRIIEVEVVA